MKLADRVEAREFTYCTASYRQPELRWEHFLVWTTSKPEARNRARAYATDRWGPPHELHVYPRNYIREARELVAEGRYPVDEGG
jgi:hypothetical protein